MAHSFTLTRPTAELGPGNPIDRVALGSRANRSELSPKDLRRLFQKPALQQSQETQQGEEVSESFPGRQGYDSSFLGRPLPLPSLDPSIKDKVATLIDAPDQSELKYTNYSVVMNKERRQAFYSVVNIDGAQIQDLPRGKGWVVDGRIPRDQQLGNEAYGHNPIDRGHLVRRRDPVWGPEAARANSDTFVYTNAGLQHGDLNQKTWLDLENHILDQAVSKNMKLTVLTGPVFDDTDPVFDNNGRMDRPTRIPQEFWKVVVWNDPKEGLKGAAFVQSQKDYLGRGIFQSSFESGAMNVYQLPLDKLEKITNFKFGDIHDTTGSTRRISSGKQVLVGS